MARRLSDERRRQIDREYPHQVQVSVPRDGLARETIGWMDRWCLEHCRGAFIQPDALQGEGTHHIVRMCFAEPEDADRFRQRFGGDRIAVREE